MTSDNKPGSNPQYTVNISASPGEDSESWGYDAHFFNRAIISLSEFFLFNNACVLFGHDWREDGVMRAVADAAEKTAASRVFKSREEGAERMVNIVPEKKEKISTLANDAEDASGGILKVNSLDEYIGKKSDALFKSTPLKLIYLRKVLTEALNPGIRVCLGGKTEGYTGFLPGIVEEALFALKYGKPLYIVGGFGGTANLVAKFLLSDTRPKEPKKDHIIQLPPQLKSTIEILYSIIDSNFFSPIDDKNQSYRLNVPLRELFRECRTKELLLNNGLNKKENKNLAISTDLEEIKHLIHHGYQNVMAGK
jgi:hypothetical protein